jgi:hypothetical protein
LLPQNYPLRLGAPSYTPPDNRLAVAKLDSRLAPAYSIAQAAHYLRFPVPPVRSWVHAATYEEIVDALAYERAA